MQWLDWKAVWLRCEEVCPLDVRFSFHFYVPLAYLFPQSVCSIPMWPIAWYIEHRDSSDVEFMKPRCMRIAV
jgi:hypothetical protein